MITSTTAIQRILSKHTFLIFLPPLPNILSFFNHNGVLIISSSVASIDYVDCSISFTSCFAFYRKPFYEDKSSSSRQFSINMLSISMKSFVLSVTKVYPLDLACAAIILSLSWFCLSLCFFLSSASI